MLLGLEKVAISLQTRRSDDVTVIDIAGRLALGQSATALRDLLRQVTADGALKILLNLRDLSFIDSSGLGELASGHANVRHKGGAVKLAAPPKRVLELLQITGLIRVLDVYETEAEALRGWASHVSGASS
jgi:anti-sigma B factor antagonist